jgi:hypothetical protein
MDRLLTPLGLWSVKMDFLRNLFGGGMPADLDKRTQEEVERLFAELVEIGKKEDFLSERPGNGFNGQCHHVRSRAIGKRLNEIGGLNMMQTAREHVRKKLKASLASHLDYAWQEIGAWKP